MVLLRFQIPIWIVFTVFNFVQAVFQNGDSCGVDSSDFFKVDFNGKYRVAGTGCDLGNGNTNCLCGINYVDTDQVSEWIWQCGGAVKFGPVAGKTCPDTIPVPQTLDTTTAAQSDAVPNPVTCDTSINPTGLRGDPSCYYNDCDQGGDSSSVCGCVDLQMYGIGNGTQWFCLHATCSCTNETKITTDNTTTPTKNSSTEGGGSGSGSSSGFQRNVMIAVFLTVVAAINFIM